MITIALIEDDIEDQQLICASLNKIKGFTIKTFLEAGTFINYLEQANELPGMVILDIGLPGINGWELLSVIKTNSSWHNIPVIILSSYIDEKMMEKYFSLNADAYYVKPTHILEYERIFLNCLGLIRNTVS